MRIGFPAGDGCAWLISLIPCRRLGDDPVENRHALIGDAGKGLLIRFEHLVLSLCRLIQAQAFV